jgi:protein phosphatase 1 regulatory subunit 10
VFAGRSSGKCCSAPHNRERKKKKKEIKETHRQMDVFSNASAWLQHSPAQVAQSSPAVQNDIADPQRPPTSTDWKDRPPSASGSNGASAVSGNIDLHDFGLGDLSGKHRVHAPMTPNGPDWVYPAPQTSSTSLTSSSPFFNYPNNFFLSSVPSPYNAMGYGPSSWAPQPGQVPLSTYSTLNGATSANSQTPPSQLPQTNIEWVPWFPALSIGINLSIAAPP